jgi:hypothetical protein
MTTEPRRARVRLWVVALAVVGGDLISRAIFAAQGVSYIATDLQIFAYVVVWVLGLCWVVSQASDVRSVPGGLLWALFTVAAITLFTVATVAAFLSTATSWYSP